MNQTLIPKVIKLHLMLKKGLKVRNQREEPRDIGKNGIPNPNTHLG